MIELVPALRGGIAPLFEGIEETLVWSCLDGSMGRAWADDAAQPQSARIITGEMCFFGGKPYVELIRDLFNGYRFSELLICDPAGEWLKLLQAKYGERLNCVTRYAFEKTADFDRERLRANIAALPQEYECRLFDGELYDQAMSQGWSHSFCDHFEDGEDYLRRGIGVGILRNGELVAGASSYTVYRGGIEIEIDTREDCRRQGLARVSASALILACLERGLFPSWDAANLWSVSLAEQLGYRFAGEYPAWILPQFQSNESNG